MQIYVKTLQGHTLTIDAESSDAVATIKARVEALDSRPVASQRFIFSGKELEDGKTLSDYNVQKDSTLHLVMRDTTTPSEKPAEEAAGPASGVSPEGMDPANVAGDSDVERDDPEPGSGTSADQDDDDMEEVVIK